LSVRVSDEYLHSGSTPLTLSVSGVPLCSVACLAAPTAWSSWCPFLSVLGCSVLVVSIRQLIPQDLAGMAPGPELARCGSPVRT
jgi:hypothetical protein